MSEDLIMKAGDEGPGCTEVTEHIKLEMVCVKVEPVDLEEVAAVVKQEPIDKCEWIEPVAVPPQQQLARDCWDMCQQQPLAVIEEPTQGDNMIENLPREKQPHQLVSTSGHPTSEVIIKDPLVVKKEPIELECVIENEAQDLRTHQQSTEQRCVKMEVEVSWERAGKRPRKSPLPCESETESDFETKRDALWKAPKRRTEAADYYSCDICSKTVKTRSMLQQHMRSHVKKKSFVCETCNSSFTKSSNLKRHKLIHSDLPKAPKRWPVAANLYSCDICSKTAKTPSILEEHMRSHSREKPFICGTCNSSFTTLGNLKRHELIHTGEKSYSCETCKKQFRRMNALKDHERIHTGVKPYSCEVCKKEFAEKSNWRRHQRVHTVEKPYRCKVCQKGFNGWGNLKTHERLHTGDKPYECEICKKKFTGSGNLKRHERLHRDDKPYECTICHKQLSQSSSLKEHIRKHTGEKPFSCEICKRSFSALSSFKRHQQTHTSVWVDIESIKKTDTLSTNEQN